MYFSSFIIQFIIFSSIYSLIYAVRVDPFPFGLDDRPDPFSSNAGLTREGRDDQETSSSRRPHHHHRQHERPENFNQHNTWGFHEESEEPSKQSHHLNENEKILLQRLRSSRPKTTVATTTVDPEEDLKSAIRDAQLGITTTDLPPDPKHNGLLKDIGAVGVGFGVGVGVPGNDPVSVGTGVSVGLDGSGPAGGLPPFSEAIFPRQGEQQSLNDYDGNKDLIVSGKARKWIQAVNLGFIQLPKYAPPKSLVGVNSGIGVLGAQAPSGG